MGLILRNCGELGRDYASIIPRGDTAASGQRTQPNAGSPSVGADHPAQLFRPHRPRNRPGPADEGPSDNPSYAACALLAKITRLIFSLLTPPSFFAILATPKPSA